MQGRFFPLSASRADLCSQDGAVGSEVWCLGASLISGSWDGHVIVHLFTTADMTGESTRATRH